MMYPFVLLFLFLFPGLLQAFDDRELLVDNGTTQMLLPVESVQGVPVVDLESLTAATRSSLYHDDRFVRFLTGRTEVQILPRNPFYRVNGVSFQLLVPPVQREGRLLVPLPFLEQVTRVEASWYWDPGERELRVRRPGLIQGFAIQDLSEGVALHILLAHLGTYSADFGEHRGWLTLALPDSPAGDLPEEIFHPLFTGFAVERRGDSLRVEFGFDAGIYPYEIYDDPANEEVVFLFSQDGKEPRTASLESWQPPRHWKLDTVIIDPGHGGKDPGAVSPWGLQEKEVVLPIALELARLLRQDGDLQVFLTREDDRFLTLGERTRLANEHQGKLFVSIHANSSRNRRARGFELYLLSPARNERALRVALKENSVVDLEADPRVYEDYRTGKYILLNLAQTAYVREAGQLALVLREKLRPLIRPHHDGINQAGFYVLWGASMPALLVETGFLTNQRDHRLLASPRGRRRLARALYEAIREFKEEHEQR